MRLLSERHAVVIGRSCISELERNRDANKIPGNVTKTQIGA